MYNSHAELCTGVAERATPPVRQAAALSASVLTEGRDDRLYMSLPEHSVSVAAVVFNATGAVLAVRRRDTGQWELPGGVLERGETLEQGLRREVAEEAGVVIDPGPLTGVYQHKDLGVVALVYRCRVAGDCDRRDDETSEVRWMTRGEVQAEMLPTFAVRVFDALADRVGLLPAPLRPHVGNMMLDRYYIDMRASQKMLSADDCTRIGLMLPPLRAEVERAFQMAHSVYLVAVVVRGDSIMMVEDNNDCLELPSGRLHRDQDAGQRVADVVSAVSDCEVEFRSVIDAHDDPAAGSVTLVLQCAPVHAAAADGSRDGVVWVDRSEVDLRSAAASAVRRLPAVV